MNEQPICGLNQLRVCPRAAGFTLIEMLVVIAILGLLAALLVPGLSAARTRGVRAKCLANLREINTATTLYAGDHEDQLPARGAISLPHQIGVIPPSTVSWDLNKLLVARYMSNERKVMFCPSRLYTIRNPTVTNPDYTSMYCTYAFNYMPSIAGTWIVPQPDLSRFDRAQSSLYAIWNCLSLQSGAAYLGHDAAGTAAEPDGCNSVRLDGSASWVAWSGMEHFFTASNGQKYFWPKP